MSKKKEKTLIFNVRYRKTVGDNCTDLFFHLKYNLRVVGSSYVAAANSHGRRFPRRIWIAGGGCCDLISQRVPDKGIIVGTLPFGGVHGTIERYGVYQCLTYCMSCRSPAVIRESIG